MSCVAMLPIAMSERPWMNWFELLKSILSEFVTSVSTSVCSVKSKVKAR